MSDRLEEIADLLARVKQFCGEVGREPFGMRDTLGRAVEDRLLVGVPQMQDLCTQIENEISFAMLVKASDEAAERERMLAKSEHRLDVMLAHLGGLLSRAQASKTAHELVQQVEQVRRKRSQQASLSARASTGKRGQVELRQKAIEQYQARRGEVRSFAKAFAEEHGVSAATVRAWIRKSQRGA